MGATRGRTPAGLGRGRGQSEDELATIAFFQGAVQHADEKARTVVAVQTMITALVATQAGFLGTARSGSVPRTVLFGVLICFAVAYAYASLHILLAIRPRTAAPSSENQFAFPSVAAGTAVSGRAVRREQAQELTRLLASLAMRKHRHVRSALAGTCLLFATALALIVAAAIP
ncbi:hypothetical protein ACWEGE_30275 [Amycolatopsis sp. NPDC004747]